MDLPEVLSDALDWQATVARGQGDDNWRELATRSLEIALSAGLHEQASRAHGNYQCGLNAVREFERAEEVFVAASAYCEEHEIYTDLGNPRGEFGTVLERSGRWDEAVALCAESGPNSGPSPFSRLDALIVLGVILARRDEPGAFEFLDEAATLAEQVAAGTQILRTGLARAEAYSLRGDIAAARAAAERAQQVCASLDPWDRGAVQVWLRATGSDLSASGDFARPYQLRLDGDHQGAAELWRNIGCPYEAALALLDSSEEASLREALGILTGLGATRTAAIARQKMRQAGARSVPVGPRAATRADPAGLTRREAEVLDLICAGHTNAEIAAKLFISAKTVDHHVSAVLAKLEVTSRNAAATRAAELRLTHS
jgi:DNA-binding CsgD family transcriptional regulator